MRNLLALIVIVAAAYYGWKYWQDHPDVVAKYIPALAKATPEPDGSSEPDSNPSAATPKVVRIATPPPFVSKLAPSDAALEKMPAGVFLVLERTGVETKDGFSAVVPGDKVSLLERRNDGTMKVTDGKTEFVMRENQLTQDVAEAKEAEKKDWAKRYGGKR